MKLRSVCWCSVKTLLLVGLDRKKCHFRRLSSGLGFSPSHKELAKYYHISKMVKKWLLYKGTPGQWHRNGMVKFTSWSLVEKARILLVLVVVPCYTLQFKHPSLTIPAASELIRLFLCGSSWKTKMSLYPLQVSRENSVNNTEPDICAGVPADH